MINEILKTSLNFKNLIQPNLIFLGSDEFSCKVLEKVLNSKNRIFNKIFILTPPIAKSGRNLKVIYHPPLSIWAKENNLICQNLIKSNQSNQNPLKNWSLPNQFLNHPANQLAPFLITASFPYFVPHNIIQSFNPFHCLNVHPSLLPAYRGPAPIQWQIAHHITQSGVTIQDLSLKGFDTGNILLQNSLSLSPNINFNLAQSLLADLAGNMICHLIQNHHQLISSAKPQDPNQVTHAPKIHQTDLRVNPNSTLNHINARFRAMGHQYPLNIQVDSELFFIIPVLDQNPSSFLKSSLVESQPGTIAYDKQTKLLGIRLAFDSEILLIKSLKLVAPGGKGWLDPSAWWDRLLNQRRQNLKKLNHNNLSKTNHISIS